MLQTSLKHSKMHDAEVTLEKSNKSNTIVLLVRLFN